MGDSLPVVNLGTGLTPYKIFDHGYGGCVLFTNLQAKCWGINQYGELLLGDTGYRGDGAGEMGDSLPFINFGSALKTDYSS